MSRAARYAAERAAGEQPDAPDAPPARMRLTAENTSAFVETAIELAIRRGEFDDLPGAGKPLEGLGTPHDPDWWIRRKIERENLTGLGPPALRLRVEDRELEGELDRLHHEAEVREVLEDFNRRVIEARRQLLGGPPVVTPTRDIEAEVRAWSTRRADRAAASAAASAASGPNDVRRGGRARRGAAGRRRR
jgi:hypothetical protein